MKQFVLLLFLSSILLNSCRVSCTGIKCAACAPYESASTILFKFDTSANQYTKDQLLFMNLTMMNKNTNDSVSYSLNIGCSYNDYSTFCLGTAMASWYPKDNPTYYIYRLSLKDSSKTWTITDMNIGRENGEDCCDCGNEWIIDMKINDTLYTKSQLPLIIRK